MVRYAIGVTPAGDLAWVMVQLFIVEVSLVVECVIAVRLKHTLGFSSLLL